MLFRLYLGYRSLKDANRPMAPVMNGDDARQSMSDLKAFAMGFVTNALNPKAVVFFLSLFSSLISLQTPVAVKAGYGLVMAVSLVLWFIGVSLFFTIPSVRERFLSAGRWIMRVSGFVFIGLGLKLATEKMHG